MLAEPPVFAVAGSSWTIFIEEPSCCSFEVYNITKASGSPKVSLMIELSPILSSACADMTSFSLNLALSSSRDSPGILISGAGACACEPAAVSASLSALVVLFS